MSIVIENMKYKSVIPIMASNTTPSPYVVSATHNVGADAYKVFGVEPTATNEEIRKKYRKLALQYHPDRVATLGNDIKENAKRKFQELNEAKEIIWKERGMV